MVRYHLALSGFLMRVLDFEYIDHSKPFGYWQQLCPFVFFEAISRPVVPRERSITTNESSASKNRWRFWRPLQYRLWTSSSGTKCPPSMQRPLILSIEIWTSGRYKYQKVTRNPRELALFMRLMMLCLPDPVVSKITLLPKFKHSFTKESINFCFTSSLHWKWVHQD